MRKDVFIARDSGAGLACLCVLIFVSIAVSAQGPAAPPLPKDPKQLLLLAQKQNRLTNPDIGPWHLKLSIKQFDPSGAVTSESQIEEFWSSESKHKITYTTPTGSSTVYTIGPGLSRSEGSYVPGPLSAAERAFTNPIFENAGAIEKWILKRENRKENGEKLVCLKVEAIKVGSETRDFKWATYCLDSAQSSLVSRSNSDGPGREAVYTRSGIQDFHGYYVPQEVELTVGGKRTLEAHLDLIEDLPKANDALFSPPSGADLGPVVRTANVPGVDPIIGGFIAFVFLHGDAPVYPVVAQITGIKGTVILAAKITKDGSVTDLRVISGPAIFQQAAIDAVQTWKYRPALLGGKPVEVETTINVTFGPDR